MTDHRTLSSESHRDLRIKTEPSAELGDAVMACFTIPYEFRQVQAHYPIVFQRDAESGRYNALALFGFTNGENLFLDDGMWDASYIPMAHAIQPFLIGRPSQEGGENQVHIDMEHARISKDGEGMRVFDDSGVPTPYLELIAHKLGNLHEGHQDSADFYEAMKRYDLLEPFKLEVPLKDGSQHSLVGFETIHEERLQALGGDELADLHKGGHLMPAFMVLASMNNFTDLIRRKNDRVDLG